MKQPTIKLGLVSIALGTFLLAAAARAGQTFSLYWENDGTFIKPNDRTDRHYTDGIKLVYTHQPDCNWLKDFAKWNNFADKDADSPTALGYFVGNNMYTPDHIGSPEKRSNNDRVFAGWLYGGIFAQRAAQNRMEHFELNLGSIGPSSQTDDIQHFIHELVGADHPKGWENQLGDEFAADFLWQSRQTLDFPPVARLEGLDSHLEYGFTAGSVHRNANLGLILRWGCNLPNDFGPGRLDLPAAATAQISEDSSSIYLFTRVGGKLVQYDRFLSGVDEEPAVGLIQLGIVGRYKSLLISYSQTFSTREYKQQPDADSFGSLHLSWFF